MFATVLTALLQVASPSTPVQTAPPTQQSEPDHHLVSVRIKDARTLDKLLALDLDLASCQSLELPARRVEVIATDADIATLNKAGLNFVVEIRNLEDYHERQLARWQHPHTLTPPVGKGAMGGHYTLAQIIAILDKFAKDYPAICSKKVSLGKSHEGRDIWMVKISDNVANDENEPEVLYDSLHHAREPLGATTTLLFMDWLLSNYANNDEAKYIVNNRELFFVPCVNPDGYEYNRRIRPGGGGMWRKNRRRNNSSSYGVDLNRNWASWWTAPFGGNSTNPNSNTYRGPAPTSEPEIRALENFIKSRKFVLGNSCHTYTEILLRPWGYRRADPPNVADYRKIDAAATRANGMRAGAAANILYIAAGTALDHYHTAHGMYGYTPELGRSSEGGFWPNPTNQVRIANRHLPMFKTFALVAGATLRAENLRLAELGGNNNGKVDPGESATLRMDLVNDGAAATLTNAIATLRSKSTGVTITRGKHDFGKVAKFATINNDSSPLLIKVDKSFSGVAAKLELEVTWEGSKTVRIIDVPFVTPAPIVGTAFEKDLGFRRAGDDNARTGRFERAAPQQTSNSGRVYQPGNDHSPNGTLCWVTGASAGSSVGANDVDSGRTSFLSPLMDLRHVALPRLAAWIYYSESVSPGDPFEVAVSSDGGANWKTIYSRTNNTTGWQRIAVDLPGTMTDKMQFRFRAMDQISQSLVEACVDDLEIEGVVKPGDITLLSGGQRGSSIRLALHGQKNAAGLLLVSPTSGNLPIPGIGTLRLGLVGLTTLNAVPYGSKTTVSVDATIPNLSGLIGAKLYWQQLLVSGNTLRLGNSQLLQVR